MYIVSWTDNNANQAEFYLTEKDAKSRIYSFILDYIIKSWALDYDDNFTNAVEINNMIKEDYINNNFNNFNDILNGFNELDMAVSLTEAISKVTHPQFNYLDDATLLQARKDCGWKEDGTEEESIESTNTNVNVNNHTCISCGNTKCSKNEASCWRCGAKI